MAAAVAGAQSPFVQGTTNPPVIVFSSRTCRHCKAAKSLLNSQGVQLQDIDIGSRPEQRKTLSAYTQMTSVPQIFVGSHFVGGNDELQKLHTEGALKALFAAEIGSSLPRWLSELLSACSEPAANAIADSAALTQRLAALEDAPCTAASDYTMAVLQRTKLGQVAPLKAGFFVSIDRSPRLVDAHPPLRLQQSSSTYKDPASVGPYMNSCTTLTAARNAFSEHGCSASAADGYASFAVHSGALIALNGHTTTASPCDKKWPLALHGALRDFMVRGYLTPPASGADSARSAGADETSATSSPSGSFAHAQDLVRAAIARSSRSSLPNMIHNSLGLNASWESHVMPLLPNTEHDSAAAASPPSLDGQTGVPASCSQEAERAAAIAAVFADCLDSVMVQIAPIGEGGYVYSGLTHTEAWKNYLRAAALLRRCCAPALPSDARKALFLNVYNGLMIHGMVFWGAPATDSARWQFFGKATYLIGGLSYSLDDVEHGVLRCNAAHPYRLRAQFTQDDLRLESALQSLDPRVHFAMVCGAKSCPPVRVFRPESLDQELHEAATAFCSDSGNVQADLQSRVLSISRILFWFNKDFGRGAAGDVAHAYVKQYATGPVGEALAEAERTAGAVKSGLFSSASKRADKWRVSFLDYDWGTNGVGLMKMIT